MDDNGTEQDRGDVAARIRDLRGRVPQQLVADRVGVTLRAYQAWEAGGGIGWENLRKLAKHYSVTEEFILYGSDDAPPTPSQLERIEHGIARLERIEHKLDALLAHFGLSEVSDPAELLEQELADASRPSPRRGRGRVSSDSARRPKGR